MSLFNDFSETFTTKLSISIAIFIEQFGANLNEKKTGMFQRDLPNPDYFTGVVSSDKFEVEKHYSFGRSFYGTVIGKGTFIGF